MSDFALSSAFQRTTRRAPQASGAGRIPAVLAIGLGVGLGATYYSVSRNVVFGAVEAGPWTAWPADRRARRRPLHARLGGPQRRDAAGRSARASSSRPAATAPAGRCSPSAPTGSSAGRPQARYWTITAQTPNGQLIENPARRYGFTSAEIVRGQNGQFTIEVAREARPGAWLPVTGAGRFDLVMRLYDTPVSVTSSVIDPATVPRIEQAGCS